VERTEEIPRENSDSLLSIGVAGQGVSLFDVVIHNGKIALQIEKVSPLFCSATLASDKALPTWLLIRLTPLQQKTMISVHVAPLGAQQFTNCINYEYDGIINEYTFTLRGLTGTGMDQDVLQITPQMPFPDAVEQQLRKIQFQIQTVENITATALHQQWWYNLSLLLLFLSTLASGVWKVRKLQKAHLL
jgi:hypothetical protein|tara:strand:+ start:198 stop:764 length:567 start_codon:yes stop_codon:yes gene_type:complete